MQILLVEDDVSLALGVQKALMNAGFVVNHVKEGKLAIGVVRTAPPDIIILDLGLPDIDGLDVLKDIRRARSELPVLILTARAELSDKVSGLELGADDYLPKPFEIPELIARLHVMERRLGSAKSSIIEVGNVRLDASRFEVYLKGELVVFPRREYMLLKSLMENVGKIQTREHIENKLYQWGSEVSSNAIEVHIHHLRKKLGSDFIKTIRGVGYTIKNHDLT